MLPIVCTRWFSDVIASVGIEVKLTIYIVKKADARKAEVEKAAGSREAAPEEGENKSVAKKIVAEKAAAEEVAVQREAKMTAKATKAAAEATTEKKVICEKALGGKMAGAEIVVAAQAEAEDNAVDEKADKKAEAIKVALEKAGAEETAIQVNAKAGKAEAEDRVAEPRVAATRRADGHSQKAIDLEKRFRSVLEVKLDVFRTTNDTTLEMKFIMLHELQSQFEKKEDVLRTVKFHLMTLQPLISQHDDLSDAFDMKERESRRTLEDLNRTVEKQLWRLNIEKDAVAAGEVYSRRRNKDVARELADEVLPQYWQWQHLPRVLVGLLFFHLVWISLVQAFAVSKTDEALYAKTGGIDTKDVAWVVLSYIGLVAMGCINGFGLIFAFRPYTHTGPHSRQSEGSKWRLRPLLRIPFCVVVLAISVTAVDAYNDYYEHYPSYNYYYEHYPAVLTPAPTPFAAPTAVTAWVVTSGLCSIDSSDCLSSPSYPLNYANSENCTIQVVAIGGKFINVISFYTESGYDFLIVNGYRYSGGIGPSSITPVGTIEWRPDDSITYSGWKLCLEAWTVTSGLCSVDSSGCLMSFSYPYNYTNNDNCSIQLGATDGKRIHVISFETEFGSDFLTVNGERYSGDIGPIGITPLGSIEWSTDASTTGRGWKLCLETEWSSSVTLTTYGSSYRAQRLGATPDYYWQLAAGTLSMINIITFPERRIQDELGFEVSFEIKIRPDSQADGLYFFVGATGLGDGELTERDASGGYVLAFELYTMFSAPDWTRGRINLIKDDKTVVSYDAVDRSDNSVRFSTGDWVPITVNYTRGEWNTWRIVFNGIDIISYSDAANAAWLSTSGALYGFGFRCGGMGGTGYVRRVTLSTLVVVTTQQEPQVVTIRLNPGPAYGRVEAADAYNGPFYPICGSAFDQNEAWVICRQLGFDGLLNFWVDSSRSPLQSIFGLHCNGDETRVEDCEKDWWPQCYANVSVQCKNWKLLGDENRPHFGIVYHYFNRTWGIVCSTAWTNKESDALCRTLRYEHGALNFSVNQEGLDTSEFHVFSSIRCDVGSEETVDRCKYLLRTSATTCPENSKIVSVRCNVMDNDLQLVPGPKSGRVEMYASKTDRWGTICSNGWEPSTYGTMNAMVACQQLFFFGGFTNYEYSLDGNIGQDAIILAQVHCVGDERMLFDCPNGGWLVKGNSGCELESYASVSCRNSCGKGQYLQTDKSSAAYGCNLCPPGNCRATEEHLNQSCSPCSPGTYVADYGASQCVGCGPGRVASGYGASECVECGLGRSESGFAKCLECSPGRAAAEHGSTECTECSQGSYSSHSGASQCTLCGLGSYAHEDGASQCIACPLSATTWMLGAQSERDCVLTHYCDPSIDGSCGLQVCLAGQTCVINLQAYPLKLLPNTHRLGIFRGLDCSVLTSGALRISVSNDDDPLQMQNDESLSASLLDPLGTDFHPNLTFAFEPLTSSDEKYLLCFCAHLHNMTCNNLGEWSQTVGQVSVVGPKSVSYNLVRGWTYETIGPVNLSMSKNDMRLDKIYLMRDCKSQLALSATDRSPTGEGFWVYDTTDEDLISFNFGISPLKPDAGKYELCWCRPSLSWSCNTSGATSTKYFWIPAVLITLEGVVTGQEFSCSVGQKCNVLEDVDSIGQDEGDRLAIQISCGAEAMVDGMPGDGIYQRQWPEIVRGKFEVAAISSDHFLTSTVGMYRVCFCRISSSLRCDRGVAFLAKVGLFLAEGPYIVDTIQCKIGASGCVLQNLKGLNLKERDQIKIFELSNDADTCSGACGNVSAYNLPSSEIEGIGSGGTLTFDFGQINATSVPGKYRICWRPGNGTSEAGFQAFVGYIIFNCPRGFFQQRDVSTGQDQCILCPFGYYCSGGHSAIAATKNKCPTGATTLDVGQSELKDCVCRVGMVSTKTKEGIMTCTLCPAGTYQPTVSNMSECLPCPTKHSNVGTTSISGCLCAPGEIDTNNDSIIFACQPIVADSTNALLQLGGSQEAVILPSIQGALEMKLRTEASTEDTQLLGEALVNFLALRFDVSTSAIIVASPHQSPRVLAGKKRLLLADRILALPYRIRMFSDTEATVAMDMGISLNDLTADLKANLRESAWPLSIAENMAMAKVPTVLDCGEGYAFPIGIRVSSIDDCVCSMGYQQVDFEGMKKCTACPLGKYKSTIGYQTCTSCGASTCDNSDSCPDLTTFTIGAISKWACFCPPGYYSRYTWKPLECMPCGVDHVCEGGSAKRQCPQDAFTQGVTTARTENNCFCSVPDGSPGRASLDCSCGKGYYKYEVSGLAVCQMCPGEGIFCLGGFTDNMSWPGIGVDPISAPGYYMTDRDKSVRCIVEVNQKSVCLGGQSFGKGGKDEDQCVGGHTGPLCGACGLYYTRDGQSTKGPCRHCSELGESSAMITSILTDVIMKGAWGMFVGKRSLDSLVNTLRIDAVALRIAMQWAAVCGVLKQFKLSEVEVYGWSQAIVKSELEAKQAANITISDSEVKSAGVFKFPPWFGETWETLFAFTGSLPESGIGSTQEYLECLAVRHLSPSATAGWVAVKYLFPLTFWLAYPLFLCITLAIWGFILAKVIYPLWIVLIRCLGKKISVALIEMGGDPEMVGERLTIQKLTHFISKPNVKARLRDPMELMELVDFEVVAQIIGHQVWSHGGKEKLEPLGMKKRDLDYTMKQILEDFVQSEVLQAAKMTKRDLMLKIGKAWWKPDDLVGLICGLVVPEDGLYHIKSQGGNGRYLLGNVASSSLVQTTMDVGQDGVRWKVESGLFGDNYWLIKWIGAESDEQGCILSVNPESSGFTFVDSDNDDRQRWIIREHPDGGYTFSVRIGIGEERFLSFEANGTKVILSPIPDENARFLLPATFEVRRQKMTAVYNLEDHDEAQVVADYSVYIVFGILRDGSIKNLLFDLLPFMLITIYTVWDTLTKRFFLALQTMVVYMRDSEDRYRPWYLWRADTRVEVFDKEHILISIMSLTGLIGISLGFLLGLLLYIRKNRADLMDPTTFRLVGFFFNGLEPDRYYWELGVKRIDVFLVYVVTYTQYVPDVKAKLMMYVIIAGCAWVLHAAATPFDDRLTGLLDRIEYDALRARFFLFTIIQILLMADAAEAVNVAFAIIILAICAKTILTIIFSWLVEVFGGGDDDASLQSGQIMNDVQESLGEAVNAVTRHSVDSSLAKLGGEYDGPNASGMKQFVKASIQLLTQMGVLKLVLFVPLLLMRPFLEGRKLASSAVPLFQYRPSDSQRKYCVVVCYHFSEGVLLPLYKRFFRKLMVMFYHMDNERQRKYVADISAKFFDHLATNAGVSVLPGYVFDLIYMLPQALMLARRRNPPPMVVDQAALLKEARFLAKIYRGEVKVALGAKEVEIAAAINAHKLDIAVSYEDRRNLNFAISAEQINAGLMWLYRQPAKSLATFIGQFCEITHGVDMHFSGDPNQEEKVSSHSEGQISLHPSVISS